MLVSLTKTKKNENNSGKALNYNKEAAEIQLSSKIEDGCIGKDRKDFTCFTPPLV